MSLSVCLLTRNEEKNLGRMMRSVTGLADQVVVADAASRDRTVQIATELGAEVHSFAWEDDFAAGRNFAVGQATGDWILWMNADEELLPGSHEIVRACMTEGGVLGYFVLLHNLVDAARPDYYIETADLRLFGRWPDLRFAGRCQPGLHPALLGAVRHDVRSSQIALRSYASLTERTEAKLRWTARLLELELRDRPGQLRYLIEYGRTLLLLKDPKGHAVLAEAIEQILAARDAAAAPSWKVQVLLEDLLAGSPEYLWSRLSRREARELALRWFPSSPPLLYRIAEQLFREGDIQQAARLLERLVHLGKTGTYDKSRTFDPGLVGDDALINLSACYRQLGELEQAEQCYRQLLTSRHFQAQAAQGLVAVQSLRLQRGKPAFPVTGERRF